MTRIFTDGAEFGDTLFWSYNNGGSATTSNPRSGTYCYYINEDRKDFTAISEFYFRFCFYAYGLMDKVIVNFRKGTTTLCDLYFNSAGKMQARVNGSAVATSTASYRINDYDLIEIHLKIADAGVFQVKINGILDIDYSGDTKPGSDTTIDNIYMSYGTNIRWDDIAMNDTAGGVDDSWCGDGHIELLTPNGNGDTNDWTGSDGNKVDNYLLVDDIPATGDDYNKSSTAAEQQMYNLTDFTGTGKVITRVWPECRAKDNDVSGGQIKLGMKTASTHLSSSSKSLTDSYARVVGDDELTNPADSTPWEDADLDSIQFVVECE